MPIEYVGGDASDNVDDDPSVSVPAGAAEGDYIFFAAGGDAGTASPSGSGWTFHGTRTQSSSQVHLWGKFIGSGDPTSYSFSGTMNGGMWLGVFSGVSSVNTTNYFDHGDSYIVNTPLPAAWSSGYEYGDLALVVGGWREGGQWPTGSAPFGWRTVCATRRWPNSVGAFLTFDPKFWDGTHNFTIGIDGAGATAFRGVIMKATIPALTPTQTLAGSRPYKVEHINGNWEQADITVPATAQAGDLVLVTSFTNNYATGIHVTNRALDEWLGLAFPTNGSHAVIAYGYIVKEGDAGVKTVRVSDAGNSQSHVAELWRNVDLKYPISRIVESGAADNHTFNWTAEVNTSLLLFTGADIGASSPNVTTSGPWTEVREHNRWNPWGFYAHVSDHSDNTTVSGLHWDNEGSNTGPYMAVELNGIMNQVVDLYQSGIVMTGDPVGYGG